MRRGRLTRNRRTQKSSGAARLGTDLAGRAFASGFKALKALRPDRPIHPRGISLAGELIRHGVGEAASPGLPREQSGISWLDSPGTDQVKARFSRSIGLPDTLPDILGLAVRLDPGSGLGGDILFATTGWGIPARFLLVPKLDVSTARFTTLMPYKGAGGPVLLGLRTLSLPPRATGRAETGGDFRESLAEGEWVLALSFAKPGGRWIHAGTLRLRAVPGQDDTPERFDPIKHPLPGAETYPWTRRLREHSYRTARGPAPHLPGNRLLTPRLLTPRLLTPRSPARRRAGQDAARGQGPQQGGHETKHQRGHQPGETERKPMATVTQTFNSPAADVWKVIADGWLYSSWVVGASRIRAVDAHWPEVGSRLHHSVGAWPLVIDDSTKVTAVEPGKSLELIARGWPLGEAKVRITLEDEGPRCRVSIIEDAIHGPGRAVPKMLRDPAITIRNRETLKRLELMAAGGAGDRSTGGERHA